VKQRLLLTHDELVTPTGQPRDERGQIAARLSQIERGTILLLGLVGRLDGIITPWTG
jgi:hypothetical protein